MSTYDKQFKEEAVRLSDEIGVKKAATQLGVPYYTLADWQPKKATRRKGICHTVWWISTNYSEGPSICMYITVQLPDQRALMLWNSPSRHCRRECAYSAQGRRISNRTLGNND